MRPSNDLNLLILIVVGSFQEINRYLNRQSHAFLQTATLFFIGIVWLNYHYEIISITSDLKSLSVNESQFKLDFLCLLTYFFTILLFIISRSALNIIFNVQFVSRANSCGIYRIKYTLILHSINS